ncbi:MAG TPA: GNAT family N-acetyltransferase [Ignavibacteria bacterium]|nr:GNAT family N-acetyltransferase [Ignavibacteria bacterium]
MKFELQPILENEIVKLIPLKEEDFETLFEVSSDPLVWEQHPNKDRYIREVFKNFFKGAMESKGAFLIYDNKTGKVIGSTRFYYPAETSNTIAIGYTFFARDHWGSTYNQAVKKMMLEYAFQFVDKVHFHIGSENIRSQKAIEKSGAVKIDEKEISYYGEKESKNYIYQIDKKRFFKK